MAMQTRSVRVDADALRLAEATFSAYGTTFSEFVRGMVDSIARSGRLPEHPHTVSRDPGEPLRAFESFSESMTLGVPANEGYASAPARELVTGALLERYA